MCFVAVDNKYVSKATCFMSYSKEFTVLFGDNIALGEVGTNYGPFDWSYVRRRWICDYVKPSMCETAIERNLRTC